MTQKCGQSAVSLTDMRVGAGVAMQHIKPLLRKPESQISVLVGIMTACLLIQLPGEKADNSSSAWASPESSSGDGSLLGRLVSIPCK